MSATTGQRAAVTLIDLLEERAARARGSYHFLQDGRVTVSELSYTDLAQQARAIGCQLRQQSTLGSRALLLYPPGLSFLPGFFGCLYAGVVAVPVPLPDTARLKRTLPRLQAVIEDAEPDLVLTTAATAGAFEARLSGFVPGLRWVATDQIEPDSTGAPATPGVEPESLAYLQYTSGSTATPRGVMLTHANILHNLGDLRSGFAYDEKSISVTWMPYFHDFGLVDGLLQPLYSNIPCYVLSPLTVLKRPLLWLQTIERYRATHSHGPNFAYEMCLQRITADQRKLLNLSNWRVAVNGAEPVRSETLRRFSEAFAPCGFRPDTFYPGYGLAEATLLVTVRRHDASPGSCALDAAALEQHRVIPLEPDTAAAASRTVVSCGVPQGVMQVRIVDPETGRICQPDRVGEIWLSDPSVAAGYWRKPEESRSTFQAYVSDAPSEGPFLRTGDLGFFRDGELYVTGRLKDLIIIGGANHYPQDIEWTVQSHCSELRRDHCAAFSIEGPDTEQLVFVAEPEGLQSDWQPLLERIREVIVTYHDISVAAVVLLKRGSIYKTSSGKLRRSACRQAFVEGGLHTLATWQPPAVALPTPKQSQPPLEDPHRWLCEALAARLQIRPEEIDPHVPFATYGLDSRAGIALIAELEDRLGGPELSPTLLWQYPNVEALSRYLRGDAGQPQALDRGAVGDEPVASLSESLAIVGMGCRFPGGSSPQEFWALLHEGRSAVTSSSRLPGVEGGFLATVGEFDAEFFGISANEAQAMDPQQRLLLEVAWEALEDAALPPQQLAGRRGGIFVGISAIDYGLQLFSQPDAAAFISAHSGTGIASSLAANRLSYYFNLCGPSIAIDTACSSSLVAVHQACQSLKNRECDLALAGGVNLLLSPHIQLALERAGMLSPSQRCKTFDVDADGYVRGEGCGLVVLKRLSDAQRDGDTVLSLIRASAVNQDGRSNGLTAPNPLAQQALIRQALSQAGLTANTIDYVEAHGTGTPLGDPIEMSALQAVLGDGRRATERCWVGSVKTNIGHLEAAAGIAGLIKTVLALQHAEVPPHLNLQRLNPLINLTDAPFAIAKSPQPWPRHADERSLRPRRAAVSSFGFGGTNAHVILEQAPCAPHIKPRYRGPDRPAHLFTLSAQSPQALRDLAGRYATYLRTQPDTPVADLCFTTSVSRAHFAERLAIPATSVTMLAAHLQAFAAGEPVTGALSGHAATQRPGVVFLFSGQGSQYVDMARQLYETQPQFRDVLRECDDLMRGELEPSLLSVLFGDATELLDQTAHTQPALFALEYALACLWQQWGIEPVAVMGHSLGEYVAACLAGVFGLRDGLRLVAARGRLMQQLPQDGAMLVALADEASLGEAIQDYATAVSIAAVNAPQNVVLSGDRLALEDLHGRFLAAGLTCRFLRVSHAFHSPLMTPILEAFHTVAAELDYAPPHLTWVSNLEGCPMSPAPDADYWTRHLRDPVRFADGMRWLGKSHHIFLEIGPSPVLSHLGAQCLTDPHVQWLPSLQPKGDDWAVMLDSLARLYVAGVTPDWRGFDRDYERHRLDGLPTYAFQRRRYPLPSMASAVTSGWPVRQAARGDDDAAPETDAPPHGSQKVLSEIGEWGYVPQWYPAPLASQRAPAEWLLLADRLGIGAALQAQLAQRGQTCSLVTGMSLESLQAGTPTSAPLHVVCLWGLDWPLAAALEVDTLPAVLEQLVSRLLSLLHQITNQSRRSIRLWLVSRAATALADERGPETLDGLLQSLLWGLGRVLRGEYPDWQIRLVDVGGEPYQAARQLVQECLAGDAQAEVCWRGQQRYAWRLQQHTLKAAVPSPPLGDTWLISGGLGNLGLKMAEWLVQQGVRHLLLLGRHRPNPQAEVRLAALGERGASVNVRMLDVCDYGALHELLAEVSSHWPPLQGLIHAAGVLDDGILHQQTSARFNAVLAPKVLGGWYLHLLTAHLPLRHFILFSSASGLLGNPGQSAYAAANAFLDALAGYRRARGLAGLSLNWSAWAESAADAKVARQLERHGLGPIASEQGLAVLQRLLGLDLPQIALLPRVVGQAIGRTQPLEPSGTQTPGKSTPAAVEVLQRLSYDAPEERRTRLQRHILELAASILGCVPTVLDPQRGFFDQGLDSLGVVELRNRLQRDLAQPLPISLPFNFPTVTTLTEELLRQFEPATPGPVSGPPTRLPEPVAGSAEGIAIIGMGCRLPGGGDSPEAFWALLRDGIDAISEVPPNRWDVEAYYHPDPDHPGTIVTRYGGFVDGVEEFDAVFFGISAREASHLDPQQRLVLEVCWETLEHAGVPPSSLLGTQTGVFIGISTNDYIQRLNRRPEEIDAYLGTGNALSLAANRLSYTFGLEGPSLAIDTACSSSLVAIHQACQSLRSGESDLAIGGGVNLLLDPTVSINHSRAHMLAPDGRCKAFSAAADGMVRAEGCGLVLLKRLSDALRDGDSILAIIRGSAVNQDGRTSGLTVPNGSAQQRVIQRALRQAGLEPAAISYVEAHGTGTPLGDPIEADALSAVFRGTGKRLAIGSVKTNIGHLESAAGIAGVMKSVLAMRHRTIPAHLHCESLNPQVDWNASALHIPHAAEDWLAESGPRRAGVSSFGFGGTNAHVILEEAPAEELREMPVLSRYLLPLSAKTETALCDLVQRYVAYLETTTDHPADICYTASCGRDHFAQRLAVVGNSLAALRGRLDAWLGGELADDIWSGTVASAATTSRGLDQLPQAARADPASWTQMARSYVQGDGPDWAACYHGLKLRRVVLPGHPFERQTYSVNPPAAAVPRPECYQLHWTLEADLPPPSQHSDHWLILADDRGWGEAIAAELESRGGRCTIVYRAPAVGGRRSLASDDHKGMRALLEETGRLHGVVHLWSLDNPSPSDLDADNLLAAQRHSLGSVLHLVRALNDLPQPPRVWLLSQAAQAVVPGDQLEGLAQTTLWGLGRSVALEMSRLWGGLVDLPAEVPSPQQAAAVCAALYGQAEDSQRALRAGRFYVPRLRLWAPEHRRNVTVRADASYLITGGFGSLGRQLGRWLVQQGARSLWLTGRRGATDAAAGAYLEELHRLGVTTRVGAVDVADAAALTARLADWHRMGPPLRGVVHAAGLNGQTPLVSLDWSAFATVLTPKLQGTWALQHNTAELELDFFVACSSIAGLWGGQGQAAYCAANAFLDGFAAYRQAHGQAALSVNWGPLSASAMLDEAAASGLRSQGIQPTPLASAAADLLPMLSDGAAQVAVVAADWSRFVPLYQSRCATGFFSTLLVSGLAPTIGRPEVAVKAAVRTDSPPALRRWLTDQLSSALGLTPQQLDADTPLPRLGLDSLMAVELRNHLQQQLGREVPLPDLLGDMSLNALVAILVGTPIAPVAKPLEAAGESKWVIGEI